MLKWKIFATTSVLVGSIVALGANQPPGKGFGPPPGGPKDIDRIVDELDLTGKQRDLADSILKKHHDKVRKFMDEAKGELLVQMKEVLTKEQYQAFKEELELSPGPTGPKGPKGPKGAKGPPDGKGAPKGVPDEEFIERLMSFDKNKDGKITRDELPERMRHLIELGDTNNDGALDRDEIRKLSERIGKDGPPKGKG